MLDAQLIAAVFEVLNAHDHRMSIQAPQTMQSSGDVRSSGFQVG